MGKLMKIRRSDNCAACGVEIPAGVSAYWDAATRVVRCVTCCAVEQEVHVQTESGSGAPATAAHPDPQVLSRDSEAENGTRAGDIAGGSAQLEYAKRSARESAKKQQRVTDDAEWRQSVKEQRPILGRIAVALTPLPQIGPESQPTAAWKVGAEGERRVAEVLAEASGIEVLHDRLVPHSRANIDHIVVGPSGVFVIDAKKYTGGVEVRNVGGLFRLDERLYVNNRDRTALVTGVLGQVEVVRDALGHDFAGIDVRGILCFVGCEWGWIMRMKHVKGVTALWPLALPGHVSGAGVHAERVAEIADRLRRQLKPARH